MSNPGSPQPPLGDREPGGQPAEPTRRPAAQVPPPPPYRPHIGAGGSEGPPNFRSRKGLWIGLAVAGAVVLLGAIVLVGLFVFLGGAGDKAKTLAEEFNRHLLNGETTQAYQYLDPGLQKRLPADQFTEGVLGLGLSPECRTSYSNVSSSAANGTSREKIDGAFDCPNGSVDFSYVFTGTEHPLMTSITVSPRH